MPSHDTSEINHSPFNMLQDRTKVVRWKSSVFGPALSSALLTKVISYKAIEAGRQLIPAITC